MGEVEGVKKFPFLKYFENTRFEWSGDEQRVKGVHGQIEFMRFDKDKNPIWRHSFVFRRPWRVDEDKYKRDRYFQWYRGREWIETNGTTIIIPHSWKTLKPDSPFPTINIESWGVGGEW